jgi:hypothetical protein
MQVKLLYVAVDDGNNVRKLSPKDWRSMRHEYIEALKVGRIASIIGHGLDGQEYDLGEFIKKYSIN